MDCNGEKRASVGHTIAALFLVAGTCIGGGMLALPVATGINGFVPSFFLMALCWVAMTATSLLLVEVCLWMEEEVHIITMASRLLGVPGKLLCWLLYLFICYASLVAYAAGGGELLADTAAHHRDIAISAHWATFFFLLAFSFVIYLGSTIVGRVNSILFVAMIIAYALLIGFGIGEVNQHLLYFCCWKGAWMAVPLLLTSFSFQTIVPSLVPYLKRDIRALRIALIGGTLLTFVVYALWQLLVLGIVPVEGPHSLSEALERGIPATPFLRHHVNSLWVGAIAEFFAFFALATSFLGIAFGLFDFLADGLHIRKRGWGKVQLFALLFVPTLVCVINFERIFILAMDISGGFGDTLLNGLTPIAMVWVGRYRLGLRSSYGLLGGKAILVLLFLFFAAILAMETLSFVQSS